VKRFFLSIFLSLIALSLSAQGKLPFYDRGYAGNVEQGCLVKSYPYGTLSTTHGYCFGKGWFIGLGGMFESGLFPIRFERLRDEDFPYDGDVMAKLFLDLRKTFALPSTQIFVDVKYGSFHNMAGTYRSASIRDHIKAGWYDFARPSIGIVLKRRFALSAGLDWTRGQYYEAAGKCEPYKFEETLLPHIGFSYQF